MPLLIAHRGASAEAPENTIPAIRKAWKRSSDGVEIDIHLTRDNRLAVIHDSDTSRVAKVGLPVERSTLAQLQAVDVGRWKRKRYVGRRIPSFAQAAAFVAPHRWLFAELKSGPRIAPFFVRELHRLERIIPTTMVCSFKLDTLAAVRDEAARLGVGDVQLGWICGLPDVEALRDPSERETLLWRAETAGCTWLSLHHSKVVDAGLVAEARRAGFRVATWTVDKESEASRLARVGVDAVISNDPKRVGPYLKVGGDQDDRTGRPAPGLTPTRAAVPLWMDIRESPEAHEPDDSAETGSEAAAADER